MTTTIPIENPDFTQGTAGWTFGNGARVGTSVSNKDLPPDIPVAITSPSLEVSFSQKLTTAPASLQNSGTYEGFYVLQFEVANYFANYPGYYTAEIYFGTQELGEVSGWGTKTFTQVSVTFPGNGYIVIDETLPSTGGPATGPAQGKEDFVVSFSNPAGWGLLFRNVSLTFTPVN